MLVDAFGHYWAAQDDAAAHLTLPQAEDLLREIERSRDVPVLSVAQGKLARGLGGCDSRARGYARNVPQRSRITTSPSSASLRSTRAHVSLLVAYCSASCSVDGSCSPDDHSPAAILSRSARSTISLGRIARLAPEPWLLVTY